MKHRKPVVIVGELDKALAAKSGVHRKDCHRLIAMFFQIIAARLLECRTVSLGKLGRLKLKVKNSRVARNPRYPDEEVFIPAHYDFHFVLGASLWQKLRRIPVEVEVEPADSADSADT
jgi:nucleoid DNA-binding protein